LEDVLLGIFVEDGREALDEFGRVVWEVIF